MPAVLIGACLLSSASVLAQDSPAVPPLPEAVDPHGVVNPLAGIAVSDMTSFLGRPLFSVSRRPALPAATIAAPVALAPPPATVSTAENLQLVGTLASETGRLALIRDTTRAETISVAGGDLVDGWRVVEIQSALVRIERDAQTVSLEMFRPGATPPPAAAPGRPAVAAAPSSAVAPVASPPAPQAGAAPGAPPPGTVAGTAAAAVAAQSPFRLTFGAPPQAQP